jgi:hypothetical protein
LPYHPTDSVEIKTRLILKIDGWYYVG